MAIALPRHGLPGGLVQLEGTLLDAVQATGDGEWVEVRGLTPFSIDLYGISGDTVQIQGSNAATRPENTAHGNQIGSNVTADAIIGITTPVNYLKVMVTVYGSGTITAYLSGVFATVAYIGVPDAVPQTLVTTAVSDSQSALETAITTAKNEILAAITP